MTRSKGGAKTGKEDLAGPDCREGKKNGGGKRFCLRRYHIRSHLVDGPCHAHSFGKEESTEWGGAWNSFPSKLSWRLGEKKY